LYSGSLACLANGIQLFFEEQITEWTVSCGVTSFLGLDLWGHSM
jgi:hypothetical protein